MAAGLALGRLGQHGQVLARASLHRLRNSALEHEDSQRAARAATPTLYPRTTVETHAG